MRKVFIVLLLAGAVYACNQMQSDGISSPAPDANIKFCDSGSANALCSYLPIDIDTTFPLGYASSLDSNHQPPFDHFSWQTFIALNWPANFQGQPIGNNITDSPNNMRVWEYYQDPIEVFGPPTQELVLHMGNAKRQGNKFFYMDSKSPNALHPIKGFKEADGHPLIDRNLNFALYEIKMNPVEANFVTTYKLTTRKNIDSFWRKHHKRFELPASDSAQRNPGSMEIKASWRILDTSKGDDPARFYCRNAVIYIEGSNTVSGKPIIAVVKVGLVGMHIIRNTEKFSQAMIWSTFEHIDNTPDSPQEAQMNPNKRWSFYNPECLNCVPNDTPAFQQGDSGRYRWNNSPPYAARYAVHAPSQIDGDSFGTQALRMYPIYRYTERINDAWRAKLKGTVWANYKLIGSQWQKSDNQFSAPNAPALLANTTLETYIQPTASCITCHGFAGFISGKDTIKTDFSFLFQFYTK